MVVSRRAAMRTPSPALLAGVKAALTVLSAALTLALSTLAFVSLRMARTVVTRGPQTVPLLHAVGGTRRERKGETHAA